MLFRVHWDGTSGHGLSAAPLAIGVANTNSQHVSTEFCISYIPKLPPMGKAFDGTSLATKVKFYIRQKAVGAVLGVLEAHATRGVLCPLRNCQGLDVDLHLMPRLVSINIDQPEAQLFYGMLNRTSCSRCNRRKGYSAFRKGSRHVGAAIRLLYRIVRDGDTDEQSQRRAREKLKRYGFNPDRYCCLHYCADRLFVRTPNEFEVFPGLDFRDVMHGLWMFMHRIVTEAINMIAWKPVAKTTNLLDLRVTIIGLERSFWLRDTARSYRVQRSIFSGVNMSATDKVCTMFYLPHVFGHKGLMIPEIVRNDLLTVIARIQLMLLACRGRRMYTKKEFVRIFDEGFKVVFKCCEHIHHVHYDCTMREAMTKHLKNAVKNAVPKQFLRASR